MAKITGTQLDPHLLFDVVMEGVRTGDGVFSRIDTMEYRGAAIVDGEGVMRFNVKMSNFGRLGESINDPDMLKGFHPYRLLIQDSQFMEGGIFKADISIRVPFGCFVGQTKHEYDDGSGYDAYVEGVLYVCQNDKAMLGMAVETLQCVEFDQNMPINITVDTDLPSDWNNAFGDFVASNLSQTIVNNLAGKAQLYTEDSRPHIDQVIAYGIDINADSPLENHTLLSYAITEYTHSRLLDGILDHPSIALSQKTLDQCFLVAARGMGAQEKYMLLLLAAGADINVRNGMGENALLIAARESNLEGIKVALDFDADSTIQDIGGNGVLHNLCNGYALYVFGNTELNLDLVRRLVESEAYLGPNNGGLLPWEVSNFNGNNEIAEAIKTTVDEIRLRNATEELKLARPSRRTHRL